MIQLVEGHLLVCPACTWVLVLKGRNSNRVQVTNWWLEAKCFIFLIKVLCSQNIYTEFLYSEYGWDFYPSWRPIIPWYIFLEDEGLFPINHLEKIVTLPPLVKILHVPAPLIEGKDQNWGLGLPLVPIFQLGLYLYK